MRTSKMRIAALLFVALALAAPASAQTYAVEWRTVDGGGHGPIAGGSYSLQGTTGQPDASVLHTGGAYALAGGFWVDGVGATLPVLGPSSASDVESEAAELQGTVASDGGAAILARGFLYAAQATNGDPLPGGTGVSTVPIPGSTGPMTASLQGLSPWTTYAFRAYATNAAGTSYTAVATFTTAAGICPTLSFPALPHGIAGVPYAGSVAASGGVSPYSYAVTSGELPPGLLLGPPGEVTGIPTATGLFSFVVTATDVHDCPGAQSYDLVIGSPVAAGDLVIHEFRSRGPAGAHDEYVEVTNRSPFEVTVAVTDGSAGFGLAASGAGSCPGGAPALLAVIPNGTRIPAGGSFLAANDTAGTGYSLSDYGGAGRATPDATWTDDLCDESGMGLFRSTTTFDVATRLDAVGFGAAPALYREGAGLSPDGGVTEDGQWAFLRQAPYPLGVIKDTGDNAADFLLVSPSAAVHSGRQAALGSPGPQNLAAAPVVALTTSLADPAVEANAPPNRVVSGQDVYFRRRITNDTGAPITALRFRIVDLTTLHGTNPAFGPDSDWRALATPDVVLALSDGTTVTAKGLTLEAPAIPYPTFLQGGGYNASFTVDLADLGGALASGASLHVNVGFRNVRGGGFRFLLLPEASH